MNVRHELIFTDASVRVWFLLSFHGRFPFSEIKWRSRLGSRRKERGKL